MITSKELQAVVDQINGRFDALNKDIADLQKKVKALSGCGSNVKTPKDKK
jgi:hypothetical protein